MLKFKLTNQENKTFGGFQWVPGEPRTTNGEGDLCGPGWLHYYDSAELAILLNPIHANIQNPKLWEIEAEGEYKHDNGLKSGCTKLTLLKEIDPPIFSTMQKAKFAILCAKKVEKNKNWNNWADNWLNGNDISTKAAIAAAAAAVSASAMTATAAATANNAAVNAAAAAAVNAANNAANANIYADTDASACAATAASAAAKAAACVATYATKAAVIDFAAIISQLY